MTDDKRLPAPVADISLKIGERGDCDVVFVHDRPAELAFVERGFGIDRREVVYNDFILVGPATDPAHVAGGKDIVAAFRKIADAKAPFAARGEDSGTSKAELRATLVVSRGTDGSNPPSSSKESANFRSLNGGGSRGKAVKETVGALYKRARTNSWPRVSVWLYFSWHEPGAI